MKTITINSPIEIISDLKEANASISLNPNFKWAKVVICDDKPNANKHRIPIDEFGNLARTGLFSPIKMANIGEKKEHFSALGKPIGTHAQFSEDGNRLLALVALWPSERPDDIKYLEEAYASGFPPQLSWEISYASEQEEEDGVIALKNTVLDGTVIVDDPAYKGRTPILALASTDEKNKEKDKVDDLEKANAKIAELEAKLKELEASKKELETVKSATDTELEELRKFKSDIVAEKEKAEKVISIKNKFKEAEIEKTDEYFAEKEEFLLSLNDTALDFMIQEMVSFKKTASASKEKDDGKIEIPQIRADGTITLSAKELGQKLRESKIKEK